MRTLATRSLRLALVTLAACGAAAPAVQARATSVTVVQTTADLSQHLTRLADRSFDARPPPGGDVIGIDARHRYQRITGFGAAMTDTAAWLLQTQLPPAARARVMDDLFGPRGIRLGFVRVPIGASDFTKDGIPYTYDDVPPGQLDPALAQFSIAHDDAYIVPALRRMRTINQRVAILASPWSPPAWMKTNDALDNIANGARPRPGAYGALASYFVRFLQAYQSRGVRVDAITPQNEPGQQTAYPGLGWPVTDAARWIARDLAPALRAAGLRTKVYGHDGTWSSLAAARALVAHPLTRKTMAGVAWHCYSGNPVAMTRLHRLAPELDAVVSECSTGISPGPAAELMIASLRNWSSGVLLWNLALDPAGGPVQSPNDGCQGCTGVVTVNAATGSVTYNRDYYELGQASSFIRRGARRIASNTFATYKSTLLRRGPSYASADIDDVAFENPDGSKVLLAHNNATRSRRIAVVWRGRSFSHALPAGATATFVWDRP